MADEKELAALDAARAEMIQAISEYRPIAARELARIALVHIEQCRGAADFAREIWEEAFSEGERRFRKTADKAP
jgi:hypothetical protein